MVVNSNRIDIFIASNPWYQRITRKQSPRALSRQKDYNLYSFIALPEAGFCLTLVLLIMVIISLIRYGQLSDLAEKKY